MKPTLIGVLAIALLTLGMLPASAQMVVSAKSGVLNYTSGQVFLNDQAVESSITRYPDLKEGSLLRTGEGQVEVLLTPGVILRMGEHASLKMVTNRLIDTRLELLSGSAVVEADQIAKDTNVAIVLKDVAVTLPKPGIYRFDTEPARVKVFKGEIALAVGGQTTLVGSGRMALLNGAQADVEKFNIEDTDALDRWSRRRGELMAMANVSASKSLLNSGSYPVSMGGSGICNSYWSYNTYFGMNTFIPCSGSLMSPYGYRYWSPNTVTRVFYRPSPGFGHGDFGGASASSGYGYNTPSMTSGGYSGTMASSSGGFSGSSSSGSSSTAASSAGSSSVGHGGGGGGASGGSHGGK